MPNPEANNLRRDLAIVLLSCVVAYYLYANDIVGHLLAQMPNAKLISAFVAGFFFTSVFTIAPAGVALFEIARFNSIYLVALVGAIGGVLGDIIIFKLVRDHLTEDFLALIKKETHRARLRRLFQTGLMKFSLTVLGGVLIAAPFPPDEVGLSLLGLSKIKTSAFVPISFCFNFIGILFMSWLSVHLK